jgi:tRNA(fMet)-specific endonuclease VapC
MGMVVDTDVWVLAEKGIAVGLQRWEQWGELLVSAITFSELLVGVNKATTTERRERRSAYVEGLLRDMDLLPVTLEVARVNAQLLANLPQGITVGTNDTWIAATAMAGSHALLTRNARDFEKFPGLHLEIWTPPAVS